MMISKKSTPWRFYLISIVITITVLALFIPLLPAMPEAGLDPSWQLGMNRATGDGVAIGRDLIFTFGPYAAVYSHSYLPSTDRLMLSGSLFLSLFYIAATLIVAFRRSFLLILSFTYVLIAAVVLRDTLFMSYPLLLSLVLYRLAAPRNSEDALDVSLWLFVLLCAPLGLLPLIKGSMLLVSFVFLFLYFIFLWWNGFRAVAVGVLVSPLATMFVAWIAAGQSIAGLPDYFVNMLPIISGYGDAMSVSGETAQIVGYVGVSSVLVSSLALSRKVSPASKALLALSFATFLFVAFKAGFIRHDGHAVIAGSALIIAALLSPWAGVGLRVAMPVILAAGVCTLYINYDYQSTKSILFTKAHDTYSEAYYGIKKRMESDHRLTDDYDASLTTIRSQLPLDTLKGSTDIYAYNQAFLLATQNIWLPRPVLQSYSAYTPALAEMDREHLLVQPPDNVVFRVETIDGRIPALDDGASWPVLLNSFVPTKLTGETLYLRRDEGVADAPRTLLQEGVYRFHEDILLPATDEVLFLQLGFMKTLVGKVVSFLFKSDPLDIEMSLADGTKNIYRVIPGMTETGFILSPLVETTEGFANLFGDRSALSDKEVQSIRIFPRSGRTRLWFDQYSLKLSKLDMRRAAGRQQVTPPLAGGPPKDVKQGIAESCDGSIDLINGHSPSASGKRRKTLIVEGWTALSAKEGKVADENFITLVDGNGVKTYIKTSKAARPDVKAAFGHPDMKDPGYKAVVNLSAIPGDLTLGLARIRDGQLHDCDNFGIKLVAPPNALKRIEQFASPEAPSPFPIDACEGNIDLVNGSAPRATNIVKDNLSVAGWMTASGKDGDVADAVFVTLTDDKAKTIFYKTTRTSRPDVNAHFGRLDMPDAGFSMSLPVFEMTGNVVLSLGRLNKGKLETCPGLRLPLSMGAAVPCGHSVREKIARWARSIGFIPGPLSSAEVCAEK